MSKKVKGENYLERIPVRNEKYGWTEKEGNITLEIENKGFFNKACQLILKKPKVSYVHLDEMGSFIWPLLDGEKTVMELGEDVDAHFGEKAHPLYERLVKYFQILESYRFITWKK